MTVFLKPDDVPVIERLAASDSTETIRKRVHLLLLYEAGMKTAEIAEKVDLSPGRVLYWRRRYLKDGLGVFRDAVGGSAEVSESDPPGKNTEEPSLGKLIRAARKAQKGEKGEGSIKEPREALAAGIKRDVKRRKKLKRRMASAGKKKASKMKSRLKKLKRRIKKAKKVQKSL